MQLCMNYTHQYIYIYKKKILMHFLLESNATPKVNLSNTNNKPQKVNLAIVYFPSH